MTLAHKRDRQAFSLLLKKLKFSPIVSIQGPRQSGKSFLARVLLPEKISDCVYFSLDKKELRDFASQNPQTFLSTQNKKTLIIDEVQKIPALFDEMKSIVDIQRVPGQFLILGSTEFSIENQIKESLTGRLSRVKLFPFNLSESKKLPLNSEKKFPFIQKKVRVSRSDLMRYLENGGLPGIFSVKSNLERANLFSDWLRLTVERDIHQFKKMKLDSDLAYRILEIIATQDHSTEASIASELGLTTVRIQNYTKVLRILFVIFEVKPYPGSTGKSEFYLTDVGLAHHLKSPFEKRLRNWVYLELQSILSYQGSSSSQLYYYRTSKGKYIDFLYSQSESLIAAKLVSKETVDLRDIEIFEGFYKKIKHKGKIEPLILFGGTNTLALSEKVKIYPWESIS